MSALLNTIPGDIPGLLRRGSPILYTEALIPGVVLALIAEELGEFSDPPILSVALFGQHVVEDGCIDIVWRDRRHLTIDLTDPTGRAHAAWWFDAQPWGERRQASGPVGGTPINPMVASYLLGIARNGANMTPEQIDTLARLVLRLAGRTP